MKTKTWLTTGLLSASFFIGGNAWADKTLPNVSSDSKREASANAATPDCTTEERMKEIAKENTFAQNTLEEAKDIGTNALGAALSIFAGADIPVGEARDAYRHAKGAKQTYEIFTPCTSEQEVEIKKIKEQAAAQVRGGEDKNPTVTPPPQTEERMSEKTGKRIRALPF